MTYWYSTLFEAPVTWIDRDSLFANLKSEASAFTEQYPKTLTPPEEVALSHWYQSRDGQEQLSALFQAFWAKVEPITPFAMPAHDARHALYKVPATAIEYIQAEHVEGYGRLGVFGALFHDYGRWAEERLCGMPQKGLLHSRLSFVLARELMTEFDIPSAAKAQMLHAALQHTTGATEIDSMPTKVTVAADRDQLYGAEIVLRLFHHASEGGSLQSVYGDSVSDSVLSRLMVFVRHRLPGPLFSMPEQVKQLYDDLVTFILLAEGEDFTQRFSPALQSGTSAKQLYQRWEAAESIRPSATDPFVALQDLLQARHIAPGGQFLENALAKLSTVDSDKQQDLASALVWINRRRQEEDLRQVDALQHILAAQASDGVLHTIISKLLENPAC